MRDYSQQHVVATRRSDKIASCVPDFFGGEIFVSNIILSQYHGANNQIWQLLRFIAATKFFGRDKDFHKNFSVHAKRFVTAMCRRVAVNSRPTYAHGVICRRNVLLQLVARPVHTEWYVVSTCCCNLSPDLYTLSDKSPRLVASTCRPTCTHGVICGLGLLLQLVARPVHTERYVASTCCCNLSPDLYTRRDMWPRLVAATSRLLLCTDLKVKNILDRCSYQIAFSVGAKAYPV